VIENYGSAERRARGVAVLLVLGVVALGLLGGAAWLRWNAPVADSDNFSGPIEWNVVQALPRRAPDAADVAWERRAGSAEAASGGLNVEGQHIYVIDGDTFVLNGTRIRVAGIDAPETHPARCPYEAQIGAAATQKLAELLRGRPLWISGLKTDHWGRAVAVVRVNGEDVADAMIGSGLARNYDGKQRQGWC
jgi:endonuclease YncB( thermonuclease family)